MDEITKARATRYGARAADVRAWAARQGYDNLRERAEAGVAIHAQAVTTLTIFLAGIGGSLAYAVRVVTERDAVACGAMALGIYLIVLAVLLVVKCINLTGAPTLSNEPDNLCVPDASLEQLEVGELANLQSRIDRMKDRNRVRARWLNRLRLFALASPIAFALGAYFCR